MPPPPPLPAAVPANAGCIRRCYSLRKLRVGFSTGSPSAARRSALERDAAANPSRGVRLGRRRGPRATAPSAARLRPLRAPPRRPVLLLLLLFAGEEAGRQSEEGPVDFDFLALLSKPKILGLLRNYTHVRNYSSQLSGLIPAGPQSSKLTRRHLYFPNASPYQLWSRSFASDSGEKFEAVVPFMGESVTDGTLATFLKKPGDRVEADVAIAQIETDKVTIDVSSPEAGVLEKVKPQGQHFVRF